MAEQETSQDGGSVATADAPKDTFTLTDNRTGETYELEITDDTISAMDLRPIKVNDGRLRDDDLRPGLPEHRLVPVGDHLHRR